MKQIILKITLLIDNKEVLVDSRDFSKTIAEYEKEQEHELDKDEIIDYILKS